MERFTLKGGIFLYALFEGEFARATRDIDLLARNMPNNVEDMKKVFENIFSIECDDALRYDLDTLEVIDITEAYKKAVENGATSVLEPELEPWGQRTCYIADPEGNLIEIGSWNKPYEEKDLTEG